MLSITILPFYINVTHFLPADADIIKDDINCVPDDATQNKSEWGKNPHFFLLVCHKVFDVLIYSCAFGFISYFFALRGVMLNGGPGGPKDLGNKSTHIIRRP